MTPEEFNAFCGSLPSATHVVQWGGADVWKVGGKLFAVMWAGEDKHAGITFKPTPMSYDILRTQPGLRPAPYMASRGIRWIQWYSGESMGADDLKLYLRRSYELVRESLPKRVQAELG